MLVISEMSNNEIVLELKDCYIFIVSAVFGDSSVDLILCEYKSAQDADTTVL